MRFSDDPDKSEIRRTPIPLDSDFSDMALARGFLSMTHALDSEEIVAHVWNEGLRWHSLTKSADANNYPIVLMVEIGDTPDMIVSRGTAVNLEISEAKRVIFDTADLSLMVGGERFSLSIEEASFNLMRLKLLPILKENLSYDMLFLNRELFAYPQ